MVAAYESYSVGIADFQEEEEGEGLDGVEASVDKVAWVKTRDQHMRLRRYGRLTHKDVVCFGTETPNLEQLHQVEELSMYVSAYLKQLSTYSKWLKCCYSQSPGYRHIGHSPLPLGVPSLSDKGPSRHSRVSPRIDLVDGFAYHRMSSASTPER